ncbi:hypothetical protein [Gemmobacter sp. 24YEA27]|uniref:hypothetical protein n=1 Tax=Gemmobacter sp. 24YEA27 TaxID=3040672 RepID=UPI0024B338B8|nr:hypothetical protein [Gemmobacter sp. 24YEA27]
MKQLTVLDLFLCQTEGIDFISAARQQGAEECSGDHSADAGIVCSIRHASGPDQDIIIVFGIAPTTHNPRMI